MGTEGVATMKTYTLWLVTDFQFGTESRYAPTYSNCAQLEKMLAGTKALALVSTVGSKHESVHVETVTADYFTRSCSYYSSHEMA